MANTYELIASSTVGSGGNATITFSSIPQTYTDLLIKTSANSATLETMRIRFNSVSSNDYTQKIVRGTGSATNSYSNAGWDTLSAFSPGYSNDGSSLFSNNEIYIPDYTSSKTKSISADTVSEANATAAYAVFYAGLLNNTSAVTSITITTGAAINFSQYSSFYLYGIKNS
jgi:hypothetical protein